MMKLNKIKDVEEHCGGLLVTIPRRIAGGKVDEGINEGINNQNQTFRKGKSNSSSDKRKSINHTSSDSFTIIYFCCYRK